MVRDRSLPHPLFQPEAWTAPKEDEFIRLDWIVTSGGPFLKFHKALAENVLIGVDVTTWNDDLWTEEALKFFGARKNTRIALRGPSERFFELFGPGRFELLSENEWQDLSPQDWFIAATGLTPLQDAVDELMRDMPSPQPWLTLGYLPGLIRRRDPAEGIECARQWAKFAAWSSPQTGDKLELFDASAAVYEVNPTLQIVQPLLKPGEPTYLDFFWRVHGRELREAQGDSFMALVIDEIREEGAKTRDETVAALSVHGASLISAALDRMIEQAIVTPVKPRSANV